MNQDEWFDEDKDRFEIPSADGKGKRPLKRRRPLSDDWDDDDGDNDWNDLDDDFPGH